MKITAGMIEAGVAALERVPKGKQEISVTAASVFTAMDAVRRREAVKAPGAAPEYVHQSWPAWRYGPNGARQIFQSAEDVPEGWADSPKKVATFVEAAKEAGAETVADLTESVATLREAYKAKFGKKAFGGWGAAKLREKLGA